MKVLYARGKSYPRRIAGNVTVRFRGNGRARFRLQHGPPGKGPPEDGYWCDVSQLSNARVNQAKAITPDMAVSLLVDVVDRDQDVYYRHHSAGWLRVVPLDQDERALAQCSTYRVSLIGAEVSASISQRLMSYCTRSMESLRRSFTRMSSMKSRRMSRAA